MKIRSALLTVAGVVAAFLGGQHLYLYYNGYSGHPQTTEPAEGQIRVACVGDSITYGHGIKNWPKCTYPRQLQQLLGSGYHVNNYGVSGATLQQTGDNPYIAQAAFLAGINYKPDIVIIKLGTNDAKTYNWRGADAFREELELLAGSYAGAQIYLCTPAAAYFMNGKTEGEANFCICPANVAEIAEIVRETAERHGWGLIDLFEYTGGHPEWFPADGIHPNGEGAAAIARAVCDALLEK